jgi:sulfate adenylyltransferase subunit 2
MDVKNIYLDELEAESLFIIREAYAHAKNPITLFSIGKDSCVLLHLLRKAFYPGIIPTKLLHVDTLWKFQEMYKFKAKMLAEGFDIMSFVNTETTWNDPWKFNPFDLSVDTYTKIMKTDALLQALKELHPDIIFCGARRDEEISRSKERIFSFRDSVNKWNPQNQRPEVWDLYNPRCNENESTRVFPLSNWTEYDIWSYVEREQIEVVDLYLAKMRPTISFNGQLLVVDDERIVQKLSTPIVDRMVRFRTLGCYPLSACVESIATTISEIVEEVRTSNYSERMGRLIDDSSSMESKKMNGYF